MGVVAHPGLHRIKSKGKIQIMQVLLAIYLSSIIYNLSIYHLSVSLSLLNVYPELSNLHHVLLLPSVTATSQDPKSMKPKNMGQNLRNCEPKQIIPTFNVLSRVFGHSNSNKKSKTQKYSLEVAHFCDYTGLSSSRL